MEILSPFWQFLLGQLALHFPIIALYLGGFVVSIMKREKHPKIAVLSGAGFAILLLLSFVSIFFFIGTVYFFNRQYSAQTIGYLNAALGFVTTLISAGAHGLLLIAIWKDRA